MTHYTETTEYAELSDTQKGFCRSMRDVLCFIRSNEKKAQRVADVASAPKVLEHKFTDEGRREPFTVIRHAENGLVLDVTAGHV